MFLYLATRKYGVHHFHELADSDGTARHSICDDGSCRRQQSAGAYGYIMAFEQFLATCPASVVLLL